MDGNYDCIVIGGGTAGCILANRLSADPSRRVLLLEAGGRDDWMWLHIPAGYLFAIGNPRSDWMFRTQSEPGLHGRTIAYPRGKVIGGSSSINAMLCIRGQSADYDRWRAMGLAGWGWNDVLPIFRSIEDHFLGEGKFHGAGGGFRIEAKRGQWRVLDAVHEAATQMGVPAVDDFNCGDNEGVSYYHVNQRRGRRWSAATAFLKPALHRSNLRVEMNAHVERLIIENGRACGVRFVRGAGAPSAHGGAHGAARAGEAIEVRTNGEVILCAGSIGSPHILSLSGIGRGDWLQPLGIHTLLDRKGVGINLQDHLQQSAIYKVQNVSTLNERFHSLPTRALMGLDYALRRRGPLTMAPSQLGIFMRSDPSFDRANIQFHVRPASLDEFGKPLHTFPAITVSSCNLRPTSRGTVRPGSPEPHAAPLITTNFLTTNDDRKVMADAMRATRRLVSQSALKPYSPQEYLPGPSVGDDTDELADAAGRIGGTIFHPVGTAKMGLESDPEAVVDARLRVYGIGNLRVIDASVMPTIVSGNTNMPTAMIAEKGARMLIEDLSQR